MARVLFHVDLNAFFASCEELKNPSLKGKPMAVGSLSKRGVLSTANYAARKEGVHSAMPVYEALRKCPSLIIVQGDYQYYRSVSAQFFEFLRQYTTLLEPCSIDECFMDVTDVIARYKRPLDLAFEIQDELIERLGLSVSIGVAPTRFLAKMASDMKKPRGITVLRKAEIEQKLYPLPIEAIVGLGKKTVPLLKEKGITTIGELADKKNESLVLQILGRNGYALLQKVHGQSSDQLQVSSTRKSISLSRTYEQDFYTMDEVLVQARHLTQHLCNKMMREHQMGQLVSVSLRDTEFHNIIRSQNLGQYTNQFPLIYQAVSNLIEENFEPVGYRHIGIHVSSIKNQEKILQQPSIFEIPQHDTDWILNKLNRKMDKQVFMKASDLLKDGNQQK